MRDTVVPVIILIYMQGSCMRDTIGSCNYTLIHAGFMYEGHYRFLCARPPPIYYYILLLLLLLLLLLWS